MKYEVTLMSRADYCRYMSGSNEYWAERVTIEANNADEARAMVAATKDPDTVIHTVKNLAEVQARIAEIRAAMQHEADKAAKRKAKRAAAKQRKL